MGEGERKRGGWREGREGRKKCNTQEEINKI